MMNVFSGNKLLESKTMNLSDTIVHFKNPYQESYGDGVLVSFCMVRDGQVYQEQARLEKASAGQDIDHEMGSIP